MFVLAVLAFIVLPIAELWLIIEVGGAIGVLPTLALLILDSLLGAALLRSQGRAAWARFNHAIASSKVPAREVFDGAMIILGGALLLTPGFITDVFGLLPAAAADAGRHPRGSRSGFAARRSGVRWVVSAPGAAASAARPGGPPPAEPRLRRRGHGDRGARPADELEPGGEPRG